MVQRDPATRGSAVILFGIAVMIFTATTGAGTEFGFPVIGLAIAIVGLVDALTEPRVKK
jgi:hypothetical protein